HATSRTSLTPSAQLIEALSASVAEAELHDVAVTHDVVLALHARLSGRPCRHHRLRFEQILEAHHFGLDEPLLEVGMDHTGSFGGRVADVDRPGSSLLGAGREERLEPEGGKADMYQLLQSRLVLAVALQELPGVF